ncbi:SHOCT domain-containing protein [Halopelagius fulvigenes]|uniref:SHOCT domain-containing protein n=1 Tax=Halopelagius fulvigenes TaxID=1198324 RepID=A0ABD5TYM5_9EURY
MSALRSASEWFSVQAETLKENPALLGFVVALWMTLLVLFSGGNPVMAFLILAPVFTAMGYGVDALIQRAFGNDAGTAPSRGEEYETGYGNEYETADEGRAIARLRERYAAGEIGHDEFERRLERLLETEELADGASRRREREYEY